MKLLQIILVGQPELEVKLNSEELRQLRQRIGIRRQIRSLTQEECNAYPNYRLNLVDIAVPKSVMMRVGQVKEYLMIDFKQKGSVWLKHLRRC